MPLLRVRLTNPDASDTLEADILGRNWYSALTTGRHPYLPVLLPILLQLNENRVPMTMTQIKRRNLVILKWLQSIERLLVMVLKKDRDQLDGSYENIKSITEIRAREEYPT